MSAVSRAQALLREMKAQREAAHVIESGAGTIPPSGSSGGTTFEVGAQEAKPTQRPPVPVEDLEPDELRAEVTRARKHRAVLTAELDFLRDALETQRALAKAVVSEKDALVEHFKLLSKELIEANKANDAALRRMLLAGSGAGSGADLADGAWAPRREPLSPARRASAGGGLGSGSATGAGAAGAAGGGGGDGGGCSRLHSRSASTSSLGEFAAGGSGHGADDGAPGRPDSHHPQQHGRAEREPATGGGRDGPPSSGRSEISLTSAASQILLLRKEAKFAQKQWAQARRERDALKAAQSESQTAAARELRQLRAQAATDREQLAALRGSRALLAKELEMLRALLRYRVGVGAADADAALLLLRQRGARERARAAAASGAGALGWGEEGLSAGGALALGVGGSGSGGGACAGGGGAEWEGGGAEPGADGADGLSDLSDLPESLEEAIGLIATLRSELRAVQARLAKTNQERAALSERLLEEQEERVRLINDNHDLTKQLARAKSGEGSGASGWAAKFKKAAGGGKGGKGARGGGDGAGGAGPAADGGGAPTRAQGDGAGKEAASGSFGGAPLSSGRRSPRASSDSLQSADNNGGYGNNGHAPHSAAGSSDGNDDACSCSGSTAQGSQPPTPSQKPPAQQGAGTGGGQGQVPASFAKMSKFFSSARKERASPGQAPSRQAYGGGLSEAPDIPL